MSRVANAGREWVRRNAPVLALCSFAFVAALLVHRGLFPYLSGDHDEPVYRYQAQMLLDGHVTLPAATHGYFFRPWLTGQVGDRLVVAFSPGWPAMLAAGQALAGSMLVSVGLAAAGAALACFGFATEVLGDRRRALLAAAIFAGSPFFLVLAGTFLNYVVASALELAAGWALLRGLRLGSARLLVLAGAFAGLAFLTRPYDILLFAVPFGGYLLWEHRASLRQLARRLVPMVSGALPFVALMLVYNAAVCGSPLRFPTTAQNGGRAGFFFGDMALAADTAEVPYYPSVAIESLWKNSRTVPSWVLGGAITLVLSAAGAAALLRSRRAVGWLLVAMVLVFPLGYLFWWASYLTTKGATAGLGPHYYLPMVPPLAILAAVALAEMWRRRKAMTTALVSTGLVLTVVAAIPKVDEKIDGARSSRAYLRSVEREVERHGGGPSIVVLEQDPSPYVMDPFPYLANRPDLTGDTLYATYRGADTIDLVRDHPDRTVLRLVHRLEGFQALDDVAITAKPATFVAGDEVRAHVRITNVTGAPTVVAYVAVGLHAERWVLDTDSSPGAVYDVTWRISASGASFDGPRADPLAPSGPTRALDALGHRGVLRIGAAFADSADALVAGGAAHSERRYPFRTVEPGSGSGPPTVEVLLADEEWQRFTGPDGGWLPVAVSDVLTAGW